MYGVALFQTLMFNHINTVYSTDQFEIASLTGTYDECDFEFVGL